MNESDSLDSSEPPWRYYWRSTIYDRYTGRGWTTSQTEMAEYEAGEPIISEDMPFHRVLRQKVQVVGDPEEMLHVAGTLVTADQDFSVSWRSHEDALGASIVATTYRADSLVSTVSEEQLRSAGNDYPEWVQDRYLALPDTVPDRVLSLARDLTATEPTPYDRARAIETHLRAISYTLDVPLPPRGQDVVDFFLFDLQKGYCDYYATAMVVLARAADLPARLVTGYASGSYDEASGRTIVTAADAHSWVEIYFPDFGWIEFEPTAARAAIERPEDAPVPEIPQGWEEITGGKRPTGPLAYVARLWWLGAALPALAGITWVLTDNWRLRQLSPAAAGAALYQRLALHGRLLGAAARTGDTPHEFAESLIERVAELAQGRRWSTAVVPAIREVDWLTHLYVRTVYSPHPPDLPMQAHAIQTWRQLRWRLWLARLRRGRVGGKR